MVTDDDIKQLIKRIPPVPETFALAMQAIEAQDLVKAANMAQEDPALKNYLINLVNKPIYGFQTKIEDVGQIFGILGVNGAQQILYNYMLEVFSPNSWVLFKLTEELFQELQAELNKRWQKILEHLKINDRNTESAIALLPASIIVCEGLFSNKLDEVELLKESQQLDFNTILKRLCKKDLFDISALIAKEWNMPEKAIALLKAASGCAPSEDKEINTLGKWMHMLLFYELSESAYISAGLNDFIEFNTAYVADITDDFIALMGVE